MGSSSFGASGPEIAGNVALYGDGLGFQGWAGSVSGLGQPPFVQPWGPLLNQRSPFALPERQYAESVGSLPVVGSVVDAANEASVTSSFAHLLPPTSRPPGVVGVANETPASTNPAPLFSPASRHPGMVGVANETPTPINPAFLLPRASRPPGMDSDDEEMDLPVPAGRPASPTTLALANAFGALDVHQKLE
ncbi:hypothetical protein N7456_006685 [Penicillium angulare]|uniref:Uncharacterized protein n=1 Tax=Penicillium angulare TaxID=116970 RepID=A0A9W9KC59_9EURO|nr:hypothetical protein N7456_006685 [Penicillium angulare]